MKAGAQMNDYESVHAIRQSPAEPRTRTEHATIPRKTRRTPGHVRASRFRDRPARWATKLRGQKVLFSPYQGWVVNLLEVRAGHAAHD
jgi:hypothetical protein